MQVLGVIKKSNNKKALKALKVLLGFSIIKAFLARLGKIIKARSNITSLIFILRLEPYFYNRPNIYPSVHTDNIW